MKGMKLVKKNHDEKKAGFNVELSDSLSFL